MKSLIRLTDYLANDIYDIFHIADELSAGKYADILKGKCVVLFSQIQALGQEFLLKKGYVF